ncbi:radical SAM protein [bacterium]|nr:radical SAM protein [bacterium]
MGFLFEPPFEYFEKIFRHFSECDPRPSIQFFGGEPTVRKDLIDLIKCAKSYGLRPRIVTNGIKLADPDYCRKIIKTQATILLSYDGANPELYRHIRGSERYLDLKHKALDNIQNDKRRAKVTLMTVMARDFNIQEIRDLIGFVHDRRDTIRAVYYMPLAHTWSPEVWDYSPTRTTTEDIENMVDAAFPEESIEFLPAGFLGQLPALRKCLRVPDLPFLGAHPNCESLYVLISNGENYRPLGHFVKESVPAVAQGLLQTEKKLASRIRRFEDGFWGRLCEKLRLKRPALYLAGLLALVPVVRGHLRVGRVLKGRGLGKLYHALLAPLSLLAGVSSAKVRRRHTSFQEILQIVILPFEDDHCLETERLERCPAAFAFVDPEDGRVKLVPVCAWEDTRPG